MIRQCSKCYKSEYKNKNVASSGIQNMLSSTDRDAFLQNLIKVHQPIKPIKWLGFQI